jgi:hypothetical protein
VKPKPKQTRAEHTPPAGQPADHYHIFPNGIVAFIRNAQTRGERREEKRDGL